MDYSDYISWKSKLSQYTGGICPADCFSNLPCGGSNSSNALPSGRYFSDYLFYNNLTSSWQVGSDSVHLGAKAGATGIGYSSIAIGESANARNNFSIAIGRSTNLGGTNTIALNATGSSFSTNQNDSFFVTPVRPATSINVLYYDPYSKEVTYGAVPSSGNGGTATNGIPTGATQYGEYLYFNGTTWSIGSAKVSIGAGAGAQGQANAAIAIGTDAGRSNQGSNAIAIGSKAGFTSQHSNTVIINATGLEVNSEGAGRLYVKPVREAMATKALYYDAITGEVTYDQRYDGSDIDDASQWSTFRAKQAVDMSGFRIAGLAAPVGGSDAVTKDYLLSQLRDASDALPLGGGTMLGDIDMSGRRVRGLAGPIADADAATKMYVDNVRTYVDTLFPLGSNYGEYLYHDGVKWAVGTTSVNLGLNAGVSEAGDDTVAIGREAGMTSQGDYAVAIGARAGMTNQAHKSIVINATGVALAADISSAFYVAPVRENMTMKTMYYNAATKEVTYGDICGGAAKFPDASGYGEYVYYNGSNWLASGNKVNLGINSGRYGQSNGAIAIGASAGESNQGSNAIAIGNLAGRSNQPVNSIIMNATGSAVAADVSGAFYVKPVRERMTAKALYYDVSSGEISYSDISGGSGGAANGGLIGTNTLNNNTYKFRRYPYGLNINDGKTVTDGLATEQDTIANAFAKVDDWLHTYLIAQPPAPTQLNLVKKATPTSVYFAFTNPVQIKTAVFKKKLPLIEQLSVDICNNNTKYTAFALDMQYIPDISEINAFVISKVPVNPPYRQINLTVSGETVPRTFKAYYYYNNGLANSTAANNFINFWYSNYSELSANVLSAILPGFAVGSAPGAPRNLVFNGIGQMTFKADWIEPQFSDLSNGIQSTDFDSPLLAYNLKYKGVDAVRYGGPVNSSEFTITGISPTELTLPYGSTIVHPGTKYNVSIVAYNNTISTTGPELSGSLVTFYPSAPPLFSTKTLKFATNYSYIEGSDIIRNIQLNANISNVVLKDYINSESLIINSIPIHLYTSVFNTDKAINTGINIMKLYGEFAFSSYGTKSINSLLYNGFSYNQPTTIAGDVSDIELVNVSINDYYAADSNLYNKGFYLTSDVKFLMKPGNFLKGSQLLYSLTAKQYQNDSTTSINISTNFYLDDLKNVPVITNSYFDINSSSFTKISGISVLNTPLELNTVTDVSNIASHFYVANNLMDFQLMGDSGNTIGSILISNVADRSNYSIGYSTYSGKTLSFNTVKFNLNSTNTPGLFTKQITLKSKARNLVGYSEEYSNPRNIIIDIDSVQNVKLFDMSNIPVLMATSKSGRLNTSDSNGTFNLAEFSYFRNKYNQADSLLTNKTLQINRGRFVTPVYSGATAYIDYNGIENNSGINYSSISGSYRYTTFIWKIDTASDSYNFIQFKIKNIAGVIPTITNNSVYFNNIANKLIFNYRFENINNPNILEQNKTSVWIDGNATATDTMPTLSLQHTYLSNNGIIGGRPPIPSTAIISGNDLIYKLTIPTSLILTENNAYIYALVGIPINVSFGYSHLESAIINS